MAFENCQNLSSLTFEEGNHIKYIGMYAFYKTGLRPANVKYPKAWNEMWHSRGW